MRAPSLQRLDRDGDDLAGRGDIVRADQLRPALQPLARRVQPVALDRQHLPGIAQPQRARGGGEACLGNTTDLRRVIAAQRHHPEAGGIDKAEHAPLVDSVHPAGEAFLELDHRRQHAVIAVAMHHILNRAHHTRCRGRIARQAVFEALGQQISVRFSHGKAVLDDRAQNSNPNCAGRVRGMADACAGKRLPLP